MTFFRRMEKRGIKIPPIDFNCIITMASGDFQKICREMNNLSKIIEIESSNNELILKCEGDYATQKTVLKEASNGISFSKQEEKVTGSFSLSYLNLFAKSVNLCNVVELYLKNNYPLIIVYSVSNLGVIQYCVAPKVEEN